MECQDIAFIHRHEFRPTIENADPESDLLGIGQYAMGTDPVNPIQGLHGSDMGLVDAFSGVVPDAEAPGFRIAQHAHIGLEIVVPAAMSGNQLVRVTSPDY